MNHRYKNILKFTFIIILLSLFFFVSNYLYSQVQREATVFRTQNRGFNFYTGNDPILKISRNNFIFYWGRDSLPLLRLNDVRLFSLIGFVYIPTVGFENGRLTPRCPCDINDLVRDCPVPYISNYRVSNTCFDQYYQIYNSEYRSVRYNLERVADWDRFQFAVDNGVVRINGDLDVEYNQNNSCVNVPSNEFRDIEGSHNQGETICPDGYFMKGIRFQNGRRQDALDLWQIICCKL
ncbi:MAG: hypothetical protein KatS3mg094_356 [Candidatus Parcubacteria bacterium]|nr:MAG: hypothetical protein KatS3mg094_356 [Candidatus Parcubacteria bacterium]